MVAQYKIPYLLCSFRHCIVNLCLLCQSIVHSTSQVIRNLIDMFRSFFLVSKLCFGHRITFLSETILWLLKGLCLVDHLLNNNFVS